MNTYQQRDDLLKRIGFSSYDDYLRSPLWKSVRRNVLKRDGKACRVCLAPAAEVHHRSYDESTMRGKTPGNLISLCEKCHQQIEFDGERKRSFAEVESCLKKLLGGAPVSKGKAKRGKKRKGRKLKSAGRSFVTPACLRRNQPAVAETPKQKERAKHRKHISGLPRHKPQQPLAPLPIPVIDKTYDPYKKGPLSRLMKRAPVLGNGTDSRRGQGESTAHESAATPAGTC